MAGDDKRSDAETSRLVRALQRAKETGKKSLIRSSDYAVCVVEAGSQGGSALVEEVEDGEEGKHGGSSTGTSSSPQEPSTGRGQMCTLTSWKTQEFAYRKASKIGCDEEDELPTLARGLFTCPDSHGGHRIVVRGYDKFFNEGEMPWTKPAAIAAYSRAPYELSFKENGCIIFIAALSAHQLIVTSKHSLGANESLTVSHAQKGEEWLERHLNAVGKTKAALAEQLWRQNETAVAELCDDTFEEHVLAYPPDRTGLHLHGLNANTAHFQTRSMKEVDVFARQWGFLPTRYIQVDTLEEVNKFTSTVAQTGRWEGIAIEGFVVRTRMPTSQDVVTSIDALTVVTPPYAQGQTWFYKVKFDEPYLMYRDWRELTRKMLSDKQAFERAGPSAGKVQRPELPSTKKKRKETRLFIQWCYEKMYGSDDGKTQAQPELFERQHQNQGIIHLRDMFIDYMASEEGQARLDHGKGATPAKKAASVEPFTKTLIVPVAVPGCGKTAVALALTQLFPGMGHTQSDDVQTKKTGPTFLRNIVKELDEHDVVFADRNNHLEKHREEIIKVVREWEAGGTDVQGRKKGQQQKQRAQDVARRVRLIALVWPLEDLPLNLVHHLCSDRLVERGDNHQSLRVDLGKEHELVLWQFLQTRQPFGQSSGAAEEATEGGDEAFESVISLDIRSDLEASVQTSATELANILGLPIPSSQQVRQALERARQYRVSVRKEVKSVAAAIRYYGLSVEIDLTSTLQSILVHEPEAREAFARLINAKRVVSRPHVTLVHGSDLKSEANEVASEAQKKWDFYSSLCQQSQVAVTMEMKIDCLAWNDRAMSLGISHVVSEQYGDAMWALQGKEWRPHITIGTFSEDIRPYEGKRVLCDADSGASTVSSIRFNRPLSVQGRLRGLS